MAVDPQSCKTRVEDATRMMMDSEKTLEEDAAMLMAVAKMNRSTVFQPTSTTSTTTTPLAVAAAAAVSNPGYRHTPVQPTTMASSSSPVQVSDHPDDDGDSSKPEMEEDDDDDDDDDDENDPQKPFNNNNNNKSTSNKTRRTTTTTTTKILQYREVRNAREKARCLRIAGQIELLHGMLRDAGIAVSKRTKGSILAATAGYIRSLQHQKQQQQQRQHQKQRQRQVALKKPVPNKPEKKTTTTTTTTTATTGPLPLVQRPNQESMPALLPRPLDSTPMVVMKPTLVAPPPSLPAAAFMPYALQALWGLSPPNSSSSSSSSSSSTTTTTTTTSANGIDYQGLFESSRFGMAIASLGGSIQKCNSLFCQLTQLSMEKACSMTIFGLIDKDDLQQAFEHITGAMSGPAPPSFASRGGAASTATTTSHPKAVPSVQCRGSMVDPSLGLCLVVVRCRYTLAPKSICVTVTRDTTAHPRQAPNQSNNNNNNNNNNKKSKKRPLEEIQT